MRKIDDIGVGVPFNVFIFTWSCKKLSFLLLLGLPNRLKVSSSSERSPLPFTVCIRISMQGMGTKNNKSRHLCSICTVPGVQTYMCFSNIAQFIFPKALGSRYHRLHSVGDETEALRKGFVQVHTAGMWLSQEWNLRGLAPEAHRCIWANLPSLPVHTGDRHRCASVLTSQLL